MPDIPEEHKIKMMWVLFWVFILFFIVIVFATLFAVFIDSGNLSDEHQDTLFTVFIVEIGLAIAALFYSIFGLKGKNPDSQTRIRINPEDEADIQKLVGKKVIMSPSKSDGSGLDDVETTVHNDNGPYIPLEVPNDAYSVYFSIDLGQKSYSGSFVVGTYFVDIFEE